LTRDHRIVIFIVGATASGKTSAALEIAQHWPIEVISADSRQVYRKMDIGTAKATPEQQKVAPHHLIDMVEPDEPFNLALFSNQANKAISQVFERRKIPIVVGGTGQYIWSLVEGWNVPALPPQLEIREELEQQAQLYGSEYLHQELTKIDPISAGIINPRNIRRVIRALEVWKATGTTFSSKRTKSLPDFTPRVFGMSVDTVDLDNRINHRMYSMVDAGWVGEVGLLLKAGFNTTLPSFSSSGYRELAAYISGESDWNETEDKIRTSLRKLARRQRAWFRSSDTRITWISETEELMRIVSTQFD
jgi:tRNA dimethylallyltransferase